MSALTLSIPGVGVVVLPSQLTWVDEFAFSPISQTIERGLDGAQIIHTGSKQAGRLITLSTKDGGDWVARSVLEVLYAALTVTDSMTLTLQSGTTLAVTWDHSKQPIDARPVFNDLVAPPASALYTLTLRLISV